MKIIKGASYLVFSEKGFSQNSTRALGKLQNNLAIPDYIH